jgi:hypothetical protein
VDIQKINAQVLGIFGSLDRGIPPDKVRKSRRLRLTSAAPPAKKVNHEMAPERFS